MRKIISLNVRLMDEDEREHIARISERLPRHEHKEACPVRHGASMDCVWPLAVCVPECECTGPGHKDICYQSELPD